MRTMHPDIQADLDAGVPTLTALLRVACRDGTVLGFSGTNVDIPFDDGDGEVEYLASTGVTESDIQTSGDLSVDNAEALTLITKFEPPVTADEAQAGKFDGATYRLVLVNYHNLSPGRFQLIASGPIGQVKTRDGLSAVLELRSWSAMLRERGVCERWSLTCRARFGSQPGEERFPCGFDTSVLWQQGEVDAAGVEADRIFTTSSTFAFEHTPVPGLVRFLDGRNAGVEREIEEFETDGDVTTVTLAFPAPFNIEPGEIEIREDCSKQARDEARGCKRWYGAEWPLHFRGEPDIPVADSDQTRTPGAATNTRQLSARLVEGAA